jgi:carboxylesterase type B
MIALYPEDEFSSQWERAVTAFSDTVFACQYVPITERSTSHSLAHCFNRDWMIAKAIAMSNSSVSTNVFNYRFNTPDPVQLAATPWRGVMHTSELFFLFDGTFNFFLFDSTPFNLREMVDIVIGRAV